MNGSESTGVISRRRAMWEVPAWVAGAMAVLGSPAARAARRVRESDGFASTGERWAEMARELIDQPKPQEEGYLFQLCSVLSGLEPSDLPRMMRKVFDRDGMQTGPAFFSGPIFVIELRLEPGAIIRPHNHPDFNVVTLGLEGECGYRHFEVHGDAPKFDSGSKKPFQLREMRNGVLLPGRVTTLSRTRDNLHAFQAGDRGATLLDFTTRVVPGPDNKFSVVELADEAVDPERRLFEGHWIGNPY